MTMIKIAAFALLTAAAVPSFAQMSSGNSMMAAPAIKPMTKAEKTMMAKCKAMAPEMMQKNAKCTKLMQMHQGM